MVELASKDGFELTFVALSGSDHYEDVFKYQSLNPTGASITGDSITSDITRPSILHTTGPYGLANYPPVTLPDCTSWRMVLPAKSNMTKTTECMCSPKHSCAVCRKLKTLTSGIHTPMSDFMARVLLRCHEANGVTWVCQHATGGTITYLPSGRAYPDDPTRATISSLKIRQTLGRKLRRETLEELLKNTAMNSGLLLNIVKYKELNSEAIMAKF
jgi:hypothetical protein